MQVRTKGSSGFFKDASILTIGTSIAQFLPMLIYPILSRIYDPEHFAALAAFTSLITILGVLGSGKYETAILIADKDIKASNILCLSIILSIALMIVLYIVFCIFGVEFTYDYTSGLKDLIWLAPITFVFLNIFNVYNEWCVRKQYYRNLSLNKITSSSLSSASKYFMHCTNINGLVLGDFIGRCITSIICCARLYIRDKETFKSVSIPGIRNQAVEYCSFPLYTMPAQLLNSIASAAPVFILGYFYSHEEVGYFSMTMSILLLPINVISSAVRDVFRKRANDLYQLNGRFDVFYKKLFIVLSLSTSIICISVIIFLPQIFSIVLGAKWIEAGKYAQIMLPMIGVDFIAMSLSGVFIVTQKLKHLLAWQFLYFILTVVPLLASAYFYDNIKYTILFFSIGRLISYIYLIFKSYKFSKG